MPLPELISVICEKHKSYTEGKWRVFKTIQEPVPTLLGHLKLSKRALNREFKALTKDEVRVLENKYQEIIEIYLLRIEKNFEEVIRNALYLILEFFFRNWSVL